MAMLNNQMVYQYHKCGSHPRFWWNPYGQEGAI